MCSQTSHTPMLSGRGKVEWWKMRTGPKSLCYDWTCWICLFFSSVRLTSFGVGQKHTVSQQSSCTAALTVGLPSVYCSIDRCVGMVDLFTCCRQTPSCASDVSQWILLQAVVCVCTSNCEAWNYPCQRNSPNNCDLNFTCMAALIGYWRQHVI